MPCGNKAELAIELAQGRFRQALDLRLAFMSFGTFVSDQQMSPSLESVFESLAPSDLYRVSLYCAPICQSATYDIGRRNFNDRWKRRTRTRKVDAVVVQFLC